MKKLLSLLAVFAIVFLPLEIVNARGGGRGGGRVGGTSGRSGAGARSRGRSNSKKDQKEEQERKLREDKAGLLRDARGDTE